MPRLRNVQTGSVVNVDDVTAARLGVDYEPVRPAVKEPKAPQRRRKTTAKNAETE